MKKVLVVVAGLMIVNFAKAQLYAAKESTIHFLSKSSLEDIEAKNKVAKPILDATSGDIQIKIPNKQFKFKSSVMEEHFNENYMETEKYAYTTFKGKINEKIDYKKDGENKVTCTGTMDMHGVTQTITIPGTITVKGNQLTVVSTFMVKLVDYKIKVPSLYIKNIAEEIAVDINSVLEPYVKK
jgi:polyisoprenoid-binding protein YceI